MADLKAFLSDNPRMIGAVFMMILLVAQAGGVLAGNTTAVIGP